MIGIYHVIFSRKDIQAFIILFILILGFSYIHEAGHYMVCISEGKEFQLRTLYWIMAMGGTCEGIENVNIYRASGGTLAMIVALLPLPAWHRLKSREPILISLLTIAIFHGLNGLVETVWHRAYIQGDLLIQFSVIGIALVCFGCFVRFSKHIFR